MKLENRDNNSQNTRLTWGITLEVGIFESESGIFVYENLELKF